MSPRSVIRRAEWTIGPEQRDGAVVAPLREIGCMDCKDSSGTSSRQADTDWWGLRHAGLTGHRRYSEITVALLEAAPAPTNPLREKEEGPS